MYVDLYKILENERNIVDSEKFVLGIARNKIKKYYNFKNKVQVISLFKKDDDEVIIDIDSKINLEIDFITKDNIDRIWKYLKSKNKNVAKMFYLYFMEDMTFKEISQIMKKNESTVKSNLYRMMKQLKEIFGGENYNVK